MPRLNSRGQVCAGVGDGIVSIDGVPIGRGGGACWVDDERVIYQDCSSGVCILKIHDLRIGESAKVPGSIGANFISAGGGHWIAQQRGALYGTFSPPAAAVMNLVGTDGRGAASRAGVFALCTDTSCLSFWLQTAANAHLTLVQGVAYGLDVLGPDSAIWNGGSVGDAPAVLPGLAGVKVCTVRGTRWIVGWLDGKGLVAYPEGRPEAGRILEAAPVAFHHDAVAVGGELVVAYSRTAAERPEETVVIPDATGLPVTDLTRVEIPAVGRPVWCGWFAFGPTDAPGNCILPVDANLLLRARDGTVLAQYVAAELIGTIGALDRAIADAKLANPGVPVIAYWTRALQSGRLPVGAELVGVEAYRAAGEPLADFEARVRAAVSRCPRAFVIAQSYSSNTANDPDLAALVAVYARILRDCPTVAGLLAFSAGRGRLTGYEDHPEVHALWRDLVASIPGTPPVLVADPVPVPIPQPKPKPPAPIPVPVPVPVRSEGDLLMLSSAFDLKKGLIPVQSVKSVGNNLSVLVMPGGRVFSCQPDGSREDRDPDADGGYERCRITGNVATFQPEPGKYYSFGFALVEGL